MWSLPSRSLALVVAALAVLAVAPAVASHRVDADSAIAAPPPVPCAPADPGESAPANENLIGNGTFADGMECWLQYATPDPSHIVTQITGGVLEFYRVPGPAGQRPNQAVVFQWTFLTLPAAAPLVATFDIGNSSSQRKRISVLVHESDFTDLHVCTFWLAPNTPVQTYSMRTHTTKAWANTTLSFYAASPGSAGGFYQADNVSLVYDPAGDADRTICVDPSAPAAPGGPAGPELLVNGDFSAGQAPWAALHHITYQLTGGVFEFIWPPTVSGDDAPTIPDPEPAGVVLQRTGQPATAGEIVTAQVDLGNSSPVRKRVTVLLHQWNFTDLAACTFWIEPGTPLRTHLMRTYATAAWSDATLSVYASTQGPETWILLDNASFKRTPGSPTAGTECYEPEALADNTPPPAALAAASHGDAPAAATLATTGGGRGDRGAGTGRAAALSLRYWIAPGDQAAEIEVSPDGDTWHTLTVVEPSDDWRLVTVDLSDLAGRVMYVRVIGRS